MIRRWTRRRKLLRNLDTITWLIPLAEKNLDILGARYLRRERRRITRELERT